MFSDLVIQFGTLAGVAALIAALVNIGKTLGLVPDGSAAKASAALSLVAFISLVVLNIFAPEVDVEGLDKQAGDLAVVALYILGLVVQLGLPVKFHYFLSDAEVPVVGKSHPISGLTGTG